MRPVQRQSPETGAALLPGVQQLWMNRKCMLSFWASRGSLRHGHYCSPPLSLHHAHDLTPFYLHFCLVASPSGGCIDFLTFPNQLLLQGHHCLPGSSFLPYRLFYLVTLLPHCFCSLPFLCFSKLASHSAVCVYLLDPNLPKADVIRSVEAQGLWPLCSQRLRTGQERRADGFHSTPAFQTQLVQT